ncbi:hypothetical protein D3C85_1651790 [compost metagenome]
MVEVFALEVDLRAAELFRPALGVVNRARAADKVFQFVVIFLPERRISLGTGILGIQLVQCCHQCFRYIDTAVRAEVTACIGEVITAHGMLLMV